MSRRLEIIILALFALGAGAFVIAALAVLTLGEETKGRTLESISH